MKRKPEVLLQDVFRYLKPALVFHQGGKTKGFEILEEKILKMNYDKNCFYLTKPFTGISRKEAAFLFESYLEIRKFRYNNKFNQEKIMFKTNPKRLWPLPYDAYTKLAQKIYKMMGKPNFGIRRIDNIIFGDPVTTFSNYVKGKAYSAPVIINRSLGVRPIKLARNKISLFVFIDIDSENVLKNWRNGDRYRR